MAAEIDRLRAKQSDTCGAQLTLKQLEEMASGIVQALGVGEPFLGTNPKAASNKLLVLGILRDAIRPANPEESVGK
jgi:hypothetical protein